MGNIIGLKFESDIRKSIAVDGSRQITGAVTPTLDLKAITPSDADAFIDDFVAGVVSVNASGNSFVIQGPHGHQFTVNVNGQTEWEGSETINNLTSTSIVEISGTLDRTTATFLADSVEILSQDRFFAGGADHFRESTDEYGDELRSVRAKRAARRNRVHDWTDFHDRSDG